jgi:shikimate dehydrogenase
MIILSNSNHSYHFGLIGYPVEHSLSPRLHTAALAAAHLDGDYLLIPIANDEHRGEQLAEVIQRVRSGELDGLNVTTPHKQNVIPMVDELSPAAQQIGAVNTIVRKHGRVLGDNTDGRGFMHDLVQQFEGINHSAKKALVFGAGGSARAVVYALLNDGWQVIIYARRQLQAEELANYFSNPGQRVQTVSTWAEIEKPSFDLAVNCTPVGMNPIPGQSPWPDGERFPPEVCIYDLVYSPRETRLVWQARASHIRACNGLGMLVEQAALAFELWTGIIPDRAAMKAAVE